MPERRRGRNSSDRRRPLQLGTPQDFKDGEWKERRRWTVGPYFEELFPPPPPAGEIRQWLNRFSACFGAGNGDLSVFLVGRLVWHCEISSPRFRRIWLLTKMDDFQQIPTEGISAPVAVRQPSVRQCFEDWKIPKARVDTACTGIGQIKGLPGSRHS